MTEQLADLVSQIVVTCQAHHLKLVRIKQLSTFTHSLRREEHYDGEWTNNCTHKYIKSHMVKAYWEQFA